MKVSDQIKMHKTEQQVQCHRWFNTMMANIQRQLETKVPGLQLTLGGKTIQGTIISANLSGQVSDTEGDANIQIQSAIDALPTSKLL